MKRWGDLTETGGCFTIGLSDNYSGITALILI